MASAAGKRLVILGSTGSIGVQALQVAERLNYPVTALAAGHQVQPLETQIRRYRPRIAVLYDEKAAADLRVRVRDFPVKVLAGMDGLCEAAALKDADMVLNAVVGMVGLLPTLAAIEAGRDVALANKETLVAGGALVMEAAARRGVRLLPVDSEHSAIFQCLQGAPPDRAVRRLILTASGGPFFGRTTEQLRAIKPEQALKHPNWSMGAKITIDSATMMNKGLELIEARWLFDMPPERIDIVVHRESIVHSLVEYEDRAVVAQLGVPDMRVPIQYALTWPARCVSDVDVLDLTACGTLTFHRPDDETFPGMGICRKAITRGGLYPAAVNAANEQAVALFLAGKIGFLDIARLCGQALEWSLPVDNSVQGILETDRESRRRTAAAAGKL
ncbi:MAG: 1-deoxy-D-xylulose-5-phosphate reductoisomerase [Acutalibacteraceae bacterium]|nr:1-deoxy-D-xylulose-5-phosphate reductoisomerase [Clostridiales bacterium]